MPTMIDHVVVVVRDLNEAVAGATRTGFTVTPGGEHAGGVTHNALIPFADGSYVELIAFLNPELGPTHKWWPHLQKGEGLVDFALLSTGLQDEARAINGRGLAVGEPTENGRLRPDGERLAWRAIQTQQTVGESGLPFLIEDVTPRGLRVPGTPAQTAHANGSTGVAGVTVAVGDLDAASRCFADLLGGSGEVATPDAAEIRAARVFPVGDQWIELVEPSDDEASPLARAVAVFGAGLYEVELRTGTGQAAPRAGELIDPTLMHGARFRLAHAVSGGKQR